MGLAGFLLVRHRVSGRAVPLLVACLLLANLPDLDLIAGWLFAGEGWHRTVTHTIGFALLTGLACGVAMGRWWAAVGGAALVASHLLLDLLTVDTRPPAGLPLGWPFSDRYRIAGWTPFMGIDHGSMGALLSLHNLFAAFWETLLMTPVVLAGYAWSRYATD